FVDLSGFGANSPNGAIQQQLTGMVVNTSYVVSFDLGTFNTGTITVKIGNQPPLTPTNPGLPFTVRNSSWTPCSLTFTELNTTDMLTIMNASPGEMIVNVDNIAVEVACGHTAPMCNGACPAGQECSTSDCGCHCRDIVVPCDQSPDDHCGGVCQDGQ